MKKINFFIGSNNKTKELEASKAVKIASKYYDGLNASEMIGYWKGVAEKSLLISTFQDVANDDQIKALCQELKTELQQEAIGVEILESNTLFI